MALHFILSQVINNHKFLIPTKKLKFAYFFQIKTNDHPKAYLDLRLTRKGISSVGLVSVGQTSIDQKSEGLTL